MADCRDWLATLWRASYKGFPFFVERDDEAGGRRIVVHEFPMRDEPYLEDLGEAARFFEATAYVASDTADTDAGRFSTLLASVGPGLLVLPTHGPRLVRCLTFARDRAKDRHGYIGFKLKFVRQGASSALTSVSMLANRLISAVDGLVSVAATAFASGVSAIERPDYVVSAATDQIVRSAGSIEAIRTTNTVDPLTSADVRDATTDLIQIAPDLVNRLTGADPNYVERVFEAVRDLGDAMPAADAARAMVETVEHWAPAGFPLGATPNGILAASNASEVARSFRLALLSAYAEALIRVGYASRQEAISARADLAERFEAELEQSAGLNPADLYVAIQEIRNAAIEYLSAAIIDLAPVVTVEANIALPSLYWSWRLYQDPTRATELIARNKVRHPSFFPLTFEALAR